MDRLIYTAYSGLNSSQVIERVIASNMANAQTVGFKAELLLQAPSTLVGPGLDARAMTSEGVISASLKQGAMAATGNPLDIALSGRTMLAVQADDGSEGYTRRGDLSVSPSGVLQTGDGHPVLGQTGPITVPTDARVSIGPDGSVLVTNRDGGNAPAQAVDKLKLVSVAGSTVAKALDGLFRVPAPGGGSGTLPADDEAKVTPGTLEQSNVNASDVMVQMVAAQRLFEIRTKLVQTAREVDQQSTALMQVTG